MSKESCRLKWKSNIHPKEQGIDVDVYLMTKKKARYFCNWHKENQNTSTIFLKRSL